QSAQQKESVCPFTDTVFVAAVGENSSPETGHFTFGASAARRPFRIRQQVMPAAASMKVRPKCILRLLFLGLVVAARAMKARVRRLLSTARLAVGMRAEIDDRDLIRHIGFSCVTAQCSGSAFKGVDWRYHSAQVP